ncbi:NAD(P)/FAD-dependent oxidoreductase [Balneatrix alpica]|uniref:NAD(P)/FAD-dependent oxidoreductase n=1 Tax=Balneatrix alpica TaxID=75684 RepID=UPI0027390F30|nr:FAD-dependent oxidoreductase [Balneatrix alpica]
MGSTQRLVIVGNGMAAGRLLDELKAYPHSPYQITLIGDEAADGYNRILLSPLLAGEEDLDSIRLKQGEWYQQQGIEVIKGEKVIGGDRQARTLQTDTGRCLGYDRLILATGSAPIMLGLPGEELEGVMAFRTIKDVQRMQAVAKPGARAVVIGGGLLGIEAAYGLLRQGMSVTLVNKAPWLLNRQLDQVAGGYLAQHLQQRGLALRLDAGTEAFIGEQGKVTGVLLEDGELLDATLVVIAIGVKPLTELGQQLGLECGRGILVNDQLQTSDPHIFALGECCQWRQQVFGLVAPIWDQARVLAASLHGETASYAYQDSATKLKVSGIDLVSAGPIEQGCDYSLTFEDRELGFYRCLNLSQGKIQSLVLYGDVEDGNWYLDLLQQQADVTALGEQLIFGRAYCGSALTGEQQ